MSKRLFFKTFILNLLSLFCFVSFLGERAKNADTIICQIKSEYVRKSGISPLVVCMILSRFFFFTNVQIPLSFLCFLGETGIGKSTLMDCLFKTAFEGVCTCN